MVKFERTSDVDLIRQILTESPRAYSQMKNDMAPARHQFQVHLPATMMPVLVSQNDTPVGIVLMDLRAPTVARIHFCLLPAVWGKSALVIGMKFLKWVWQTTSLNTLQAPVPSYNLLARKFALSLGFIQTGMEDHVGRKHGKPFGLMLMKMERPR